MKSKKLLPFFILFIVVSLAYANALKNEFVWDDEFLVQKNTFLRDFSSLPKMFVSSSTAGFGGNDNFYRPTQNIYYLLTYQIFGESVIAFHLGNILLHLINSWLLYLVLFRLFSHPRVALIASLLWASHPTHVEAITYISGTADPMGFLFVFLGLYALPFEKISEHWKSYALSLFSFALALLSKEAMIVFPALLILVYAFKNPQSRFKIKNYQATVPFWIMAWCYLLLRKTVLNFDQTYQFYKTSNIYTEHMLFRVFTYLATLPEYLKILFYPTDLHMERAFPVHVSLTPHVVAGLIVFFITLATSLYLWVQKKQSTTLFLWLWFFTAFVPMMGILIPVNSFILEHWLYLPSVGFFAAMAMLIVSSDRVSIHLPWVVTGLCTITLIGLTHQRNKDWKTPITFYSNILKYSKGSARVHNNLAMALADKKQWDLAIKHYNTAINASDVYPQTQYNLARAYIQTNQYEKALRHLERSLEIQPNFSYSLNLKAQLEKVFKDNRTPSQSK